MSAGLNPLVVVLATMVHAQDDSVSRDVHAPPVEGELTVDWVRFVSGEWHNGECMRVDNDQIEFDADQSGLAVWDWADVTDLYLPGTSEFVFEDKEVFKGPGRVTPEEVIVQTDSGERRRPRAELLRIVVGVETELSRWSFDLAIQFDGNRGNTRNANLTTKTTLKRRGRSTRFVLGYTGAVGGAATAETNGEVETNVFNHRGTSNFDWFFTHRFFWRTYDVYVLHDRFQDIAVEVRPSTGIGYALVEAKALTVDVSLGGAFQNTTFISSSEEINTLGVLTTALVDWDVTSDVEIVLEERLFADLRGGEDYFNQTQLQSNLDLDIDITSIFDLLISAGHQFKLDPAGTNPITGGPPLQNDFTLGIGIEMSLGK